MNILFLVHRIPYPPNKGDKIRSWNELRYLAERHRVHLGCLVDRPEDLRHVDKLRPMVASLEAAPLPMRRARIRSLSALWRREPLSLPYFRSAQLAAYVRRVLAQERIDAVFLFSSPMAQYVWRSDRPIVMDFCDVDSAKWREYAKHTGWPLSAVYGLEARRLADYEHMILQRCAAAVLVTEQEKALWSRLPNAWRDKVHVIPNGVDLEFFAPAASASAVRREPYALAFTGAMDYFANVDAVRWFATEIFPRVRAVFADATFYIVGSNPAPEVQALANRPGVVVTGFVDDIREYYTRAALCVVPLRIARGIQNKVLEAMAMARPILASREAAKGLGAESGMEICIADDADVFAAQAIRLLRDPAAAEAMGSAARAFVEREYMWEGSMRRLEALLEHSSAPMPALQPMLV